MTLRRISLLAIIATIVAQSIAIIYAQPVCAANGNISISPSSGESGILLNVIGSGFTPDSAYTLSFDSTQVAKGVTDINGTLSVSFYVPPTLSGAHKISVVTAASDSSNIAYFIITPQLSVSTSSGRPGDLITVTGKGFGASKSVKIYIDGEYSESATTDVIGFFVSRIAVPQTAGGSHTFIATDSAGYSASTAFNISSLVTIDPSSIRNGSQVEISGVGFTALSRVTLYIDGTVVNSNIATTDGYGGFTASISQMPKIPGGTHSLQVKDDNNNSATSTFVIAPEVTVNRQSGPSGINLQVSGTGFGANSTLAVEYDDAITVTNPPSPATDARGSCIFSLVVPDSSEGSHSIRVSDDSVSASASFDVTVTASLNLVRGPVGTEVTLLATGFSPRESISIKYDNAPMAMAKVSDAGAFSASFTIPASSTGTHEVSIVSSNTTMALDFCVVAAMAMNPSSGHVGTPLCITGTGFVSGAQIDINYDATLSATALVDTMGCFSVVLNAPASYGGTHTVTVTDGTSTFVTNFEMDSAPPVSLSLISPANDKKADPLTTFQWAAASDPSGVTYVLQVSRDPTFTDLVLEKTWLTNTGYTLNEEEELKSVSRDTPYYWRVKAVDGAVNESLWTETQTFYIGFVLAGWYLYSTLGVAGTLVGFVAFKVGTRKRRYDINERHFEELRRLMENGDLKRLLERPLPQSLALQEGKPEEGHQESNG